MSTALYRRYRPDTFADVIGQEHVTGPLVTALGKDAVSHAYLFSGPRGCGKTTSARILARCLNCAHGPTGTPCGECESCRDLATGGPGSLDVIEIDAASHGGVDDARDLRERATFAPVRDRYKIFIIDEAHMVTAAGFNALLKIVEEPPEHIKFIFATTEPDKVIGTIRSRTHHYPFRLVPPEPLLDYLERLCSAENVQVAPGVLQLVLRAGGGSVRDTLSVLDQLIAGAGESGLDYDRAVALLGFTHAALLDQVVDAVADLDGAQAFSVVDRVVQSGQDPRRFVEDLLERLRDLIIVKSVPESPQAILRGVPEDQIRTMQTQASKVGAAELSRAADITATALTEMVGATSPQLHLELLMARLLLPHAESGHSSLAARLERLERRLDFTAGAGSTPPGEAPREASTSTAPAEGAAQGSAAAQTGPADGGPAHQEQAAGKDEAGWAVPGAWGPTPEETSAPARPQSPSPAGQQSPGPQPEPPGTESNNPQAVDQPPAPKPGAPRKEAADAAPEPAPPAQESPAAAAQQAAGGSTDMMQRAWPDIVEAMKSRSRMLWMLVKGNVSVAGFDGKRLTLAFSNEGARNTFANRNGEQALGDAVQEVLGMQVSFELASGPPQDQGAPPPKGEGRTGASPAPAEAPTPHGPDPSPPWNAAESAEQPQDPDEPEDPDEAPGPWPEHRWDTPAPAGAWQSPAPTGPQHATAEQTAEAAAPAPSSSSSHRAGETGKPPIPAFARRAAPSDSAAPAAHEAPPEQRQSPAEANGRAAEIRQRLAARSSPAAAEADGTWQAAQAPAEYDTSPPPDWAEAPEEDIPSDDDVDLEGTGVFGRRAIERILDGVLLEEQRLDDDPR
ncbi:DNA polymerase III subunit gamma and tau [Nesterenkonia sp.]|uniref:DNA polymerase III subunit gamma and tau n=1 Tax=Nesterenkonia sp. TaxID=704201 RepID=UPI0026197B5F|nr:DNA polymerase III subunit gamma and tau [Nesterenkonia sp.]